MILEKFKKSTILLTFTWKKGNAPKIGFLCHDSHGDGEFMGRSPAFAEIGCEDCHGSVKKSSNSKHQARRRPQAENDLFFVPLFLRQTI